MSIAVLHQVFDETRRLAIAGSNLAQDDFRLKKLIPALETSGKKTPVFAKVAGAAQALVDAKPKESAEALLNLSSLVMAILYTQGEMGAEGKLTPIKPVGITLASTQTPARLLKPVIEALTTTGSGRLETVREAFERGAFSDPRLVNHAMAGLDDAYSEMGDFIEQRVAPSYGRSIVALIEDKVDLAGRGGNARRLRLLYRLDPTRARPLVLEAFEKGSKEMKLAALACLGDSAEDLPHLIDQSQAKVADIRRIALRQLMQFDTPEVLDLLDAAIDGKDGSNIAFYFRKTKSPKILQRLVVKWNEAYQSLQSMDAKAKMAPEAKTALEKVLDHLLIMCHTLPFRDEPSIQKLTEQVLDDCKDLVQYKSSNRDGGEIVEWATKWIAMCGKPALQEKLAMMHETIPDVALDDCIDAAMDVMKPKEFYDTFAAIYLAEPPESKTNKGRSKRNQNDRRDALARTMTIRSANNVWNAPDSLDEFAKDDVLYDVECRYPRRAKPKQVTFDPRWMRDAVSRKDDALILAMAAERDTDALQYIELQVKGMIAKQKVDDLYDTSKFLRKLAMCKRKGVEDLIEQLLQKLSDTRTKAKSAPRWGYSGLHWLGDSLRFLSKAQRTKLQSALEGKHESIIDEMLVALNRAEEVK